MQNVKTSINSYVIVKTNGIISRNVLKSLFYYEQVIVIEMVIVF